MVEKPNPENDVKVRAKSPEEWAINSGVASSSEWFIEKPVAPKSARYPYGPNEVGNSLMNIIKGFGRKYGFINSDILAHWDEIAGEQLARVISPVKLSFGIGERVNGTLYVRIKNASMSAVAQYQFPTIIDRVNTYFGYNAVAKVKLKY